MGDWSGVVHANANADSNAKPPHLRPHCGAGDIRHDFKAHGHVKDLGIVNLLETFALKFTFLTLRISM